MFRAWASNICGAICGCKICKSHKNDYRALSGRTLGQLLTADLQSVTYLCRIFDAARPSRAVRGGSDLKQSTDPRSIYSCSTVVGRGIPLIRFPHTVLSSHDAFLLKRILEVLPSTSCRQICLAIERTTAEKGLLSLRNGPSNLLSLDHSLAYTIKLPPPTQNSSRRESRLLRNKLLFYKNHYQILACLQLPRCSKHVKM